MKHGAGSIMLLGEKNYLSLARVGRLVLHNAGEMDNMKIDAPVRNRDSDVFSFLQKKTSKPQPQSETWWEQQHAVGCSSSSETRKRVKMTPDSRFESSPTAIQPY